nr:MULTISPECIES: VWA domain-containing protein [Streptomyces]
MTIGVLPGAAAGKRVPTPEPTVTPAVVDEPLDPGDSLAVDKKVRTPVIPPRPDVVLLVDGTRSMQPTIDNVQGNLDQITDRVREEQPDSRFAVATFGDKVDGDRVFTVLQGLTDNLDEVRRGVDGLASDRGLGSPGPAEDWINALWQIGNGAGGKTVFREGASPIVVLVGDASSHDPSMDHSLSDGINALKSAGVRVLGVDVATELGDGLNGNGDNGNGPGQNGEDPHEPDQASKVIQATGGKLFQNIDADQVADTIAEGLTNLPTTVSYQAVACDPALSVSLTPASREVTSGAVADFRETIKPADDAPQGATLSCTVQFLLNGKVPSGEMPADVPPARVFRDRGKGTGNGGSDHGSPGSGGTIAGAIGGAVGGTDGGQNGGVIGGAVGGVSSGSDGCGGGTIAGLAVGGVGGYDSEHNGGLIAGVLGGAIGGSVDGCGGKTNGGASDGGASGNGSGSGTIGGVISGASSGTGGEDGGQTAGPGGDNTGQNAGQSAGQNAGQDGGGGNENGGDGDGDGSGDEDPTPEDYQQHITITVNDVTAPVVTVDDRIVEATDKNGTKVDFTATAEDAVDGELPVTCDPASGSRFPVGTTEVTCTATDSSGNTGTDTATFTVSPAPVPNQADIAVTATADPSPRYAGQRTGARFTLTNAGPKTAKNIALTTTWPRTKDAGKRSLSALSGCTRAAPCSLAPGERLTVTQSAAYRTAVRGDIRVSVTGSPRDPRRANNTDTARIRVLQPKLTVTPKVARPGDVAVARGKDFPPGATVALTWKPGITAARSTVRVDGDGTFEAQVLVLRKDQLGPRKLRATVRGLDRLEKPVLIVQRSLQPPDFAGRR